MSDGYDKKIFARNLMTELKRSGESQRDLARLLNVTSSTVSNWCTGQKLPRMDKVEKIAAHFGVQKSDLIEDKIQNMLKSMGPTWDELQKREENIFRDYLRINFYEIEKKDNDYLVKWHMGVNGDGAEEIRTAHIDNETYKQIRRTIDDYVNYVLQKYFPRT